MTDPRAARLSDQEAVARHLAAAVRDRLAGDDSRGEVIVGREPTEVVVLGVLDPRDTLPQPASRPDLPDEPGVPVDILPPSEMGVTVWVDLGIGRDEACFEVTASFAMYLPEFPTWAQQHRWMTGGRPVDDDDNAPSASDDDDTVIGDDEAATAAGHEDDTPPPPPVHRDGGPGSTRSVRLAPVYRRFRVEATFPVCVRPGALATDGGALQAAIDEAVGVAREGRLAVELHGRAKRGVSQRSIDEGEDAYEAELDSRRTPTLPPLASAEFVVGATPDPRGGWRISLTLANRAVAAARRDKPSQTIYNAHFSARLQTGALKNLGYRLAENNWRVDPEVYAHGRFCVSEVDPTHTIVSTTTWPIHRDPVFESKPEHQPSFADLAKRPIETLTAIADEMDAFASDWRAYIATGSLTSAREAECSAQLALFSDEATRFRGGIRLLETEPNLGKAFVLANEAFGLLNTPGALNPSGGRLGVPRITSWRLFQIVFIVLGLGALAARERSDPILDDELNKADVLWFPTGGGKSEAFLGLVAVALFYDRLRGKGLGTSAMIRFPLRMLSVQQLERVLRVVVACETVRRADGQLSQLSGDPFELGYFVGRFNTPNSLTDANDDRWGDIAAIANWSDDEKRRRVVVTACPYCDDIGVVLEADVGGVRLHHRCTSCGRRVPVVVTDDEVFRTLPAVVVATVDKLAAIAFQPHFSHFTHGPAFRCPDHGFVTFAKGPPGQRRCLARSRCRIDPTAWTSVSLYDPAPALVIQDELHLLAEELGTLAAHYETLFAHLCRRGSGRPPKIITATATISDYENQIHQLYAKTPRRFPTEGFREGETFYASRLDLPRRLFIGALPSHVDTAQFGLAAAVTWREALEDLRGEAAAAVVARLGLRHYTTPDAVAELLFRYELQLFYANRKNDAERTHEQMRRLGIRGPAFFDAELLTGDTPLAQISAAIRRVESEDLANTPDARQRLAAISGTSLVSHGVDLPRLNVMHVAGMPSTNAYYVQATARAGRTDVGVIFMAFSRSFARDRAAFHFFEPQHQYANDLVEAVSLNRFAVNAPDKTATGVLSAVIINGVARDASLNPPTANELKNLSLTAAFQAWLASQPGHIDDSLIAEVQEAYGVTAPVLDPVVASYFADTVGHKIRGELENLRGGTRVTIQKCFLNKPPSSFRDIDEPVEFGSHGYWSTKDFQTLTRRDPRTAVGGEVAVAVEQEEAD